MSVKHFETLTIILPYVNGTCTVPDGESWSRGYNTPLTCQESSDSTYGYTFATKSAPIGFVESSTATYTSPYTYRQIASISEITPKLKPEGGLASRGSLSLTFEDFNGDPIPELTANGGSYFGKFSARNIFAGRDVLLKKYKIEDGVTTLVDTTYYQADSFVQSSMSKWALNCKSFLDNTYKDSSQFPPPTDASLRADIDDFVTTIPVNGTDTWTDEDGNDTLFSDSAMVGKVVRIGDEFMKISAVSGTGSSTTWTVGTRGVTIYESSTVMTRTQADEHDSGDAIQVCYTSHGQSFSDYLEVLMKTASLPSAYIDKTAWQEEFDDYWSTASITNIWSEPISVKNRLEQLCKDFMLSIWENASDRLIEISAVSAWKETSQQIERGKGITSNTMKASPDESRRVSRAIISFDKVNLADDEEEGNFRKRSVHIDTTYEGSDFYGKPKQKILESSVLLERSTADLRTQREVGRFVLGTEIYQFECEEEYLDYSVGDVVELSDDYLIDASGAKSMPRSQVLQIKPNFSFGRKYKVTAQKYSPVISDDTDFTITGSQSELNLWVAVGAPSGVVNITIVLDGVTSSSTSTSTPSIRNGAFATGSTVTIICINGSDLQGKGGRGGTGGSAEWESPFWIEYDPTDGQDGGTVFHADGIDTDIYLGGTVDSYTADGYLRAPGGGGGASSASTSGSGVGGSGGGGGAGSEVGLGGSGGTATFGSTVTAGDDGNDGTTTGTGGTGGTGASAGGDWGQAGTNDNSNGGAAGKGIEKGGATVVIHGSTASNFINGNGDTPD